jgi:hypothetical protein
VARRSQTAWGKSPCRLGPAPIVPIIIVKGCSIGLGASECSFFPRGVSLRGFRPRLGDGVCELCLSKEEARTGDPDCHNEFHHCSNHVHHLVATAAVSLIQTGLTKEVFCASMFLSQNLHFVRMQKVVESLVEKLVDVTYLPSPEGAGGYATCVKDFVMRSREAACSFL